MGKLEQQINQIKTSLGQLNELSQEQKRSLIEALDQLSCDIKLMQVSLKDTGASQKDLLATRQALASECQRAQELERQIEERTVALSQANEQLTQLNADLERQVQERTSELEQMLSFEAMLKRITDKVRDSLEERQILQTALQELTQVLGIEGCDTLLYDKQEPISTISYASMQEVPSVRGYVGQIPDLAQSKQLQQGSCFQFCKLQSDFRGAVAVLICPIFDNHELLGELLLFKRQEQSFDEQEIRLAEQVANQCAIAIRQARLYQAAQAQVTELEKLNQLKDDFLSTVSHELRTPVTNMKMAIHMLSKALMNQEPALFAELNEPGEQRSKIARYFHILLNECERETNLINDLLDLQRLETGVHTFSPTTIDLSEWLPQLIQAFEQRTQERQQRLEVNIAPNLPPLICDTASLGRILTELLNNACKYTPPEERIRVIVQAQARMVQISVSNTGIEIPPRELSLIFDKFYRIPKTDRWQQGGTGLGLALVKKLVTGLGGVIQAESGLGQTHFTVVLPLVQN